jgi:hypothetical protein
MADIENLGLAENESAAVDDAPQGDRLATWQQFLRKWQSPIAFGPFALSIFIMLKFFPNSPANWFFLTVIFTTVFWAVAVAGYALYLKYLD